MTKSRSWAVRAAGLAAITGLALSALALPPATASAPAQAATNPIVATAWNAPAAQQKASQNLPADLPGGKSVVGATSPIHDPALIIADDGTWYVYSTGLLNRENGGTIQIFSSHDEGTTWEYTGTVWDRIPAWIDEHFSDGELPGNLWAPEITEHDGTYYLYYSASRFGGNNSLTALATNTTLDPSDPDYEWVDQGLVVSSPATGLDPDNPGKTFNAIDAGIIEDADGTPYMAIGSFWYGIFLVPIEWPTGKPVENWQSQTVNIADRFMPGNPVEAPYITEHDGYYYLFVSFDSCCRGADSTYKVAVGRSASVKGPYLDKDGRDMFGGGGSVVLDSHGAITGPGGQSVFGDYLAFHYYDGSNEEIPYFPTLGLQKINWVDGWPEFDQTVELPAVQNQPKASAVKPGKKATFSATATGTPGPVAVWEKSSDGGTSWQPAETQPATRRTDEGTYRSTLEFTGGAEQDGLLVRAVFRNAHGKVTTDAVGLSVKQ
ncbi:glycoside hydrolase family 43 protein [Arthrobacter sp. S39]|uniref:glycoside hydrolase family 43 protein n=1 Tax=Arthrobacter sp. S39 TaxID=2509720 RepID=UPI0010375BDD|nr:glycoside hydrolase family 43 protein [Arthrobacter sp. S39]TAP44869.1 arabinan endo-1,5-alpha-L-arabinosidase [Arthrobacter sp. S39]